MARKLFLFFVFFILILGLATVLMGGPTEARSKVATANAAYDVHAAYERKGRASAEAICQASFTKPSKHLGLFTKCVITDEPCFVDKNPAVTTVVEVRVYKNVKDAAVIPGPIPLYIYRAEIDTNLPNTD